MEVAGTRQPALGRDAKLDGKYPLRTCDPHLSTDIALGYKHLVEVERGWRD